MVKQKLIITKGLPASGKTTWALEQVEKSNGQVKRVNKDSLRDMIDGGKWSKDREKTISASQEILIEMFLQDGFTVIVDDTNLSIKRQEMLKEFSEQFNIDFEVKDFTHVSVKECVRRDLKRGEKVGEKAIRRMYNQHLRQPPIYNVYDITLPDCVICDIDGTLAHMRGRSPYDWHRVGEDAPDKNVIELLKSLKDSYEIILFSGRNNRSEKETVDWLNENDIPYNQLYMRQDGDSRADSVVKQEMYESKVKGKFNVISVFDDRDQVVDMWRENGLKCLQVERGDF